MYPPSPAPSPPAFHITTLTYRPIPFPSQSHTDTETHTPSHTGKCILHSPKPFPTPFPFTYLVIHSWSSLYKHTFDKVAIHATMNSLTLKVLYNTTPHHTNCSPKPQELCSINYFNWRYFEGNEFLFYTMSASEDRHLRIKNQLTTAQP